MKTRTEECILELFMMQEAQTTFESDRIQQYSRSLNFSHVKIETVHVLMNA
jgi:hypothetical protein